LDESEDTAARIVIKTDKGLPFEVSLNEKELVDGQLDDTIPAKGLRVFESDATGTPTAGSVTVCSDRPLAGVIIFSGGFGLAGVGSSLPTPVGFTGPVEVNAELQIKTGIAIQNLENEATIVDLELRSTDGIPEAVAQLPPIPAMGHTAIFASDVNWDKEVDFTRFQGTVTASVEGRVSATMIQTRPDQFATLPVAIMSAVILEPAKDNTLFEDENGFFSNGRGEAIFAGFDAGKEAEPFERRAVLAFDLDSIPAGSKIEFAQLALTVTKTRDATTRDFSLHRLQKDWGEGPSNANNTNIPGGGDGGGTFAEAGDATWLHTFFDTQSWDTAGGDFDPVASATESIGVEETYMWDPTDKLVEDVQGWLDAPASNFGWVVKLDGSSSFSSRRFASRENPDSSIRPRLIVLFSTPATDLNFAQFGNGTGFFSLINLLNLDAAKPAAATVTIKDNFGEPFPVSLNDEFQEGGVFNIEIPAAGSAFLQTDAQGTVKPGAVTVTSDKPLAGVIVFGGTFGLAGVGSSQAVENSFTGPVENQDAEKIQTGIAIQNLENEPVTVSLKLLGEDGEEMATASLPALAAMGHTSLFLTDPAIDWDPDVDLSSFQGTVVATATGRIAATMIQTRLNQFATLPVVVR
jgi:hypothetical protein